MLEVSYNLYIYLEMNAHENILTSLGSNAPLRPFEPRRRP